MPTFEIELRHLGKFVFGVDEVGRGSWAGPVCAACVCWPSSAMSGNCTVASDGLHPSPRPSPARGEGVIPHPIRLRDATPRSTSPKNLGEGKSGFHKNLGEGSKKLFPQIDDSKKLSAKKREEIYELILKSSAIIGVGLASVEEIDEMNIARATFLAMERALRQVEEMGHRVEHCLIDGNQMPRWKWPGECVIGGDGLSLSIAAASIIAKVTRDRMMAELAVQHPHYGWENNAGYGTKDHVEALRKHGVCSAHRKSYKPIKMILSGD